MQTNCGVGACVAQGLLTCVNGGTIDTCAPKQPAPTDASCNNIDDDCNGAKDEDYVPTQTNCGVGACVAQGLLTCVNGATVDTCAPKQPAPSELCDSIDNNCNGAVDEGLADNDLDGVCNELDCEVNEPLDKYLVLNCYTDPSLTAKMSVEACWNDLTNAATLPGELAYIGLDYFDTGISFTGNGIKLCVHPLWTDCTDEPLPLACDHEISFETKLLGTQYIWNLVSPNPDDYQAEFHFDQTKNPDVASVQIFLYMNNSSCNYLYNAFSCN
jgi:hypothetical protein